MPKAFSVIATIGVEPQRAVTSTAALLPNAATSGPNVLFFDGVRAMKLLTEIKHGFFFGKQFVCVRCDTARTQSQAGARLRRQSGPIVPRAGVGRSFAPGGSGRDGLFPLTKSFSFQTAQITRTSLDRGLTPFFGPNSNCLFDRHYKNLAVTDFPSPGRLDDGFDDFSHSIVTHDEFKFYLGSKIDCVFVTAIGFRMALLASEALDFAEGHSCDPDLCQGLLHILNLKRFNDGLNFLHDQARLRYSE
jgi:hypothetical protein